MTHLLTPREKVIAAIRTCAEANEIGDAACHLLRKLIERGDSVGRLADAILTALASGSGDHAELEKAVENLQQASNTEAWHWGVAQDAPDCVDVRVADLRAIMPTLAENAALRAANTEAERKLAEAEARLDRWEPKPFCPPSVSSSISKEAERG